MRTESVARKADLLGELRSDLALAWRMMRASAGFTAVVLATLALGIGMNTGVFSVVRSVLITPLPYRAPEQLYRLYATPRTPDDDGDTMSAAELTEFAAQSRSVTGVTLFGNYAVATYTDGQTAESWQTTSVTPNFFEVLGVRPVVGRAFTDEDVAPGAPPVVLITHSVWQRVYGGDPRVIGRDIQLDDRTLTVAGVLPPTFVAPTFSADVIRPLNLRGFLREDRLSRMRMWRAVARVRDSVTPATLASELALLRPRIQEKYPNIENAGVARAAPLQEAMVGTAGPVLLLVMGGALLVLVITCVNIAGLFLSRAAARQRELGIRATLGAGRGRLVRQLLTESTVYGITGGAAGVALAFVVKRIFVGVAGSILPQIGDVRIDVGVLAFAAILSIACGLAFGVIPAFAATRLDLRDALGDAGSRGASQGVVSLRGRRALVSAQIAFALVLVIGAGLLTRTFVSLVRTDPGYTADARVLTFHVDLPPARYADTASRSAFLGQLTDRIHALAGVRNVGYTAVAPWNGTWRQVGFRVEGTSADADAAPRVDYATASDEYFSALGIPLRAGRVFGAEDRIGAPPVVVISESVARRFWPDGNPLGAHIRLETGRSDSADVREVVGVVGDVRPSAVADVLPTAYVSERQAAGYGGEFVVRASGGGDVTRLVPPIKQILHDLDPRLPLRDPRSVRDVLRESVARQQLAMALMGGFAALALLLAALGVYNVTAYTVLGRTREFGIRSALGAHPGSILRLVLRQELATIVVGVVCGLGLAALLAQFISTLLVGVSAHDVVTFTIAPVLLTLLGTAACLIPARAATRTQPVDALRVD